MEGDRVEAKVAGWTRYYKGEITRVNSDGTYDIRFDDGERKRGVRDDQIKGDDDRSSSSSSSSQADEKAIVWKPRSLAGRATIRVRSHASTAMVRTYQI